MKRIIILLVIVLLSASKTFSQKRITPPIIVCPASYTYTDFHIPPPINFLRGLKNAKTAGDVKTAVFIVSYNGFESNQQAKDAFQFAVDIWSTLIKSDVPIYLNATFEPLGSGVLGAAGTTGLYKGFKGAPNDSTYYNVALAEKIAGRALNVDGEPDISASFGSTFNWYLGLDGNPGNNEHDFVTVVLHEIGHGLGFFALNSYDDDTGKGTRNPGAYDHYIEDGNGVNIYDIPNGSKELGDYYTSNNLLINAPQAVAANGNASVRIYAPNNYSPGSSISHWDEDLFNGSINALLTPQIASGESIHDPGPNMMGLFADMGWVHTYLRHSPDWIVDNFVDDIEVGLQVTSDTTLVLEQPEIHYSFNNFQTQFDNIMINDGNGLYSIIIPNPGVEAILQYYITGVRDVLGRDYTSPNISTDRHKTIIRSLNSLSVPYTLADGGDFESPSDFIELGIKGSVDIWEQGVPTNNLNQPSSGTQVWKTDLDNDISKPLADFSTALISPKFDLSDTTANYNIKFDLSMDVDTDSAVAGLGIIYSIDGGLNWQDLGRPNDGRGKNWMNTSDEHILFESGNAWVKNNTAEAPQEVSYNLSDVIGNGVNEIYFALVASVTNVYINSTYVFDGIMIDDFEITKTEPRAFFSINSSVINFAGQAIQFTYISKGAETYSWDFGDGETSNSKNPSHIFQTGGTYDITLSITYPGGTHTYSELGAITVLQKKGAFYSLSDGGDMESNFTDFLSDNISGTAFERGVSAIEGKKGTASGSNAWVTGINDPEYENYSLSFLYTPVFDFSLIGQYDLSFKANYSFEEGWDGFIMEYSLDNGISWKQLEPVVKDGWYDLVGEDNPEQGWPAIPLFTGSTNNSFVKKEIDVSDFQGNENVAFRFKFLSDALTVDVGMALDDFVLAGPQGDAVAEFSVLGITGCDGQVVTIRSNSTGSISSMDWDFGLNATPQNGSGVGPFNVTYNGIGESTIILTVESPVNGTQTTSFVHETSALHSPFFTEESVEGNEAQLNLIASDGDSFQWFMDFDSIQGATKQTYLAEQSAYYSVAVNISGCVVRTVDSSIITALDNSSVSTEVFLYPNPVLEKLVLGFSNEFRGNVSIKVFNTIGTLFYSSTSSKTSLKFEKEMGFANLNRGIYFVELQYGDKRVLRKFLIE